MGAVISFVVVDVGKLWLEQFRAAAEDRRELLNSYLKATEAPDPEVWKRKLKLILSFSADKDTQSWARRELDYIEEFAELETLYRETLKVASQLVEPSRVNEPERVQAPRALQPTLLGASCAVVEFLFLVCRFPIPRRV